MSYLIAFFLLCSNIINSFSKKYVKIFPILLVIFMWILFWGNYKNPDYLNYYNNYNKEVKSLDYGYYLFKTLFKNLGFSYHFFLAFLSGLGLLLINSTLNKFIKNKSYVYFLYFFYPFLLDVVQIRNFFTMALFIFAIPNLLGDRLIDKIKYTFLIIIAASFQLTAIIYLPLIFINDIKKKKYIRRVFILLIVLFILLSFSDSFARNLIQIFSEFSDDIRLEKWIQVKTKYGFLLFWSIQGINYILVRYSKKIYLQYQSINYSSNNDKNIKYLNLIYWINIYAFSFLPFYRFASTFVRFMRNIFILNLIVYYLCSKSIKNGYKKIIYNVIIFLYVIFLFYVQIYINYSEDIVEAIFKFNIILN